MCFRCGPRSRKLILLGDLPSKISLSDISYLYNILYFEHKNFKLESIINFLEKRASYRIFVGSLIRFYYFHSNLIFISFIISDIDHRFISVLKYNYLSKKKKSIIFLTHTNFNLTAQDNRDMNKRSRKNKCADEMRAE